MISPGVTVFYHAVRNLDGPRKQFNLTTRANFNKWLYLNFNL